MSDVDDLAIAHINDAIKEWRQGDCVLVDQWFMHRISIQWPLTQDGTKVATAGSDIVESKVIGLMILTQTCDIVRDAEVRPFIEACPIVRVPDDQYHEVERAQRPNFVAIPTLADRHLVGDLDRVMTIEKPLLAEWERTPGWNEHHEGRAMACALARKRDRVAFPDDFNTWVRPLSERARSKHNKQSDEGESLRNIREIRARAAPSWSASEISITFWFILTDGLDENEYQQCVDNVDFLMKRLSPNKQFHKVFHQLVELDDMTARDYVESDALDFGYLTVSGKNQ